VSSTTKKNQSQTSQRSPGSKGTVRPKRVLVGHKRDGVWRLLVAEAATPDGRKARVLEAVDAGSDSSQTVERLIEKHKPEVLIGALPSGEVVCRVVEVPEGHDEELGSAAELLAEAELPPSIPSYRKVGGVVPLPATAGFRSALLLGWPERDAPVMQNEPWDGWTSEIVGLTELLLLARVGGISGPRAVASVDRQFGCIGVVGIGTETHAVRAALEDPSEPESFEAAAERCVASACGKAGVESVPAARSGALWADDELRSAVVGSVAGIPDDRAWFDVYGVALGVACAALRSTKSSAQLFDLRAYPPKVLRNPAERVVLALQSPKAALGLLAASLAVALLLPLGISTARLSILESRLAKVEELLDQPTADGDDAAPLSLQQQIAMYAELDRNRWPMSKLLADAAAAMPAESDDQLTLVREISLSFGETVRILGTADSLALMSKARQALEESAVFSSARIVRTLETEGGSGLIEFEITAEVDRPYFQARSLVDYSEQNLAERIFDKEGAEIWRPGASVITAINRTGSPGSRSERTSGTASRFTGGSRTTPSSTGQDPGSAPSTPVASGDNDASNARTERREMFQGGSRSESSEEQKPIPEPLTEEEIAQFDQLQAMRESVARRSAARQDGISDEVKRRLEEESTKLRARAQEAQREGG